MSDESEAGVQPPRKPGEPVVSLDPRKPDTQDTVGAAIGLFAAVVGGTLGVLAIFTGGAVLVFVGVVQLLPVVPLLFHAYRKKRYVLARVTWIAAGILFLLNAACFGVVMLALGNMH